MDGSAEEGCEALKHANKYDHDEDIDLKTFNIIDCVITYIPR
jgi:hypothetical protein